MRDTNFVWENRRVKFGLIMKECISYDELLVCYLGNCKLIST